jgi:hypothetical protein
MTENQFSSNVTYFDYDSIHEGKLADSLVSAGIHKVKNKTILQNSLYRSFILLGFLRTRNLDEPNKRDLFCKGEVCC